MSDENESTSPERSREEAKEGGMSAKSMSKAFKWIAALGIIACAVLKWLGVMQGATIGEICMAWAAVYGVGAGTIDLNIMFDKFTGGAR